MEKFLPCAKWGKCSLKIRYYYWENKWISMREMSTMLSDMWCLLQTSPLSLWPNIVFPPTALMISLAIHRVRLPLPGGRRVPGPHLGSLPILKFGVSWPIAGHSAQATVDPDFVQLKICTILGALLRKKDYKVMNTKSGAKMDKEKALGKINMLNIWYVAQLWENSENSITFLSYLIFLNFGSYIWFSYTLSESPLLIRILCYTFPLENR